MTQHPSHPPEPAATCHSSARLKAPTSTRTTKPGATNAPSEATDPEGVGGAITPRAGVDVVCGSQVWALLLQAAAGAGEGVGKLVGGGGEGAQHAAADEACRGGAGVYVSMPRLK